MKKAVRRALNVTVAAAMTMGLMTGCSSEKGGQRPAGEASGPQGQAADSGGQAGAAGKQTTIRFWDGNWQKAVWPEMETIWNQEHPDIKTEVEFQADLTNDKYMLALTNGTTLDVMACTLDWTTTFDSANLLEPLDEYMAEDSFDVNQFIQGANNASTVDGKLYGLPFRSETYAMYYNKNISSATGYGTLPAIWGKVKEVATAYTNGDMYGYGLCGANYSNFSFQYITMLRSSGSDILNADNSASELGNSVTVETAQLYKDLTAYSPASLLENDNIANRTLFASGRIVMHSGDIYDLEEIVKTNPDLNFAYAMAPTANGTERNTILDDWPVAAAKYSKKKEAAWEFVKFLTRPDTAAIYTSVLTGTTEVATRYADYPEDIVKPNAEAPQYAGAFLTAKDIMGIRQAVMDNLQLMLSKGMSTKEASRLLGQAVNGLLE